MTKQQQLELFIKTYTGTRVMVYDGFIVYKVERNHSKAAATIAQKVIDSLGLTLKAISQSNDSFSVE